MGRLLCVLVVAVVVAVVCRTAHASPHGLHGKAANAVLQHAVQRQRQRLDTGGEWQALVENNHTAARTNNTRAAPPSSSPSPSPTPSVVIAPSPSPPACVPSGECVDTGFGVCSNRGLCCATAGGASECHCNFGYAGDNCETAVFAACPNHCSSHGVHCTADGTCVCALGFEGDDCARVSGCADVAFCNGHGLCENNECVCEEGYRGVGCEEKVVCPGNCSAHGRCVASTRTCLCDPGFSGDDCSTAASPCPHNCSGHGKCEGGTCLCSFGFSGAACADAVDLCGCRHGQCLDTAEGPACKCERGWRGPMCDTVDATTAPCSASNLCSGKGRCHGLTGPANGVCVCLPGFEGGSCGVVGYSVCNASCSSHGACRDVDRECRCDAKYGGVGCQHPKCPIGEDEEVCSGHGVCDAHLSSNATAFTCTCDAGFTGPACASEATAPAPAPEVCPNECSDHGVCVHDACDCFEGWQGAACDVFVEPAADEAAVDAGEF